MTGYVIQFEGQQFSPDGKAEVPDVDAHNRAIEAKELEVWALKPDRFVAYVVKREEGWVITTWLGTKIGSVTEQSTFKNNLGKQITHLRAKGTNGARYYGSHGDSQSIRLKRLKDK